MTSNANMKMDESMEEDVGEDDYDDYDEENYEEDEDDYDDEVDYDEELDEDDSANYDGPPVYDSPFFHLAEEDHMNIPYLKNCAECHSSGPTNLCSTCKGAYYCSKSCQAKHWKGGHKKFCKSVQSALTKYDKEEENLRHGTDEWTGAPMDYLDPDNDMLGNFWGVHETRPFCRALGNLINLYSKGTTRKSVYESILAAMKLHYFNRSDNMGYRDMSPALLLRVDQDQLAFDFIRWHAIYPNGDYDWGEPREPFLHYWKYDRSENLHLNYRYSLSHIAIYALIKIRLFLHLVNIDAMYTLLTLLHENHALRSGSPLAMLDGQADVHRIIKEYLVGVPGRRFGDFQRVRDKQELLSQISSAFLTGEDLNPRIWKALVNPTPLLSQPSPSSYASKSAEECYFTIESCLPAWTAHPDCLQYLSNYVKSGKGGTQYDYKMTGFRL